MLRRFLTEELEFEKKTLAKLKSHKMPQSGVILIASRNSFYSRKRGEKKRSYIPRSNIKVLRQIASTRYLKEKIDILSKNIITIENALKSIRDYDDEHVLKDLPKVYSDAVEYIRMCKESNEEVAQSENPMKREELTLRASNGLLVRSREELIIVELLITLNVKFYYEKALVLIERIVHEDGTVVETKKTVYPDFTIVFKDGTEFYWEHCGRLDDKLYRERFNEKLKLYTDNGIFSPARLLITTSGKGESINMPVMRELVMNMILPYC